ncbi:hypothetical protein VTN31DRAFT_1149 [Thermomyces dupontii]|uniref:uncharacterized protein n=1 Tax=Talaromyces thermophilus TaxID=28565 RepID=UPI003743A02C
MASPRPTQTSHPLTPPAEGTANSGAASSQANAGATTTTATTTAGMTNGDGATTAASAANVPPAVPATSLSDSGKSRRPRDVRLIHMLLASLGVTAYQERVPLQLLDFAYRYTSSTLQDAVHLTMEGYAGSAAPGQQGDQQQQQGQQPTVTTVGGRGAVEVSTVTLQALRLSIASRLHYQFQSGLPKEFLIDMAQERNRIALPGVARGGADPATAAKNAFSSVEMGGVRLPPERFCLTGMGWNLQDGWESEGEEEDGEESAGGGASAAQASNSNKAGEEGGEEEDEGDGKMEDVFGEDTAMGEGEDEDKIMTDA